MSGQTRSLNKCPNIEKRIKLSSEVTSVFNTTGVWLLKLVGQLSER